MRFASDKKKDKKTRDFFVDKRKERRQKKQQKEKKTLRLTQHYKHILFTNQKPSKPN